MAPASCLISVFQALKSARGKCVARKILGIMAQTSSQESKGFFDSLIDSAKSASSAVVDGVGKVGSMAVDGVKSAGSAVGDVAGKAVDAGKVVHER